MADMPPTPTFVTHGWAAFRLLVLLGLQPIMWDHILMTNLILMILTYAPFGGADTVGLP